MLNLDTEDWSEIFIGCAGGGDSVLSLKVEHESASSDAQPLQLSITGMQLSHAAKYNQLKTI